MKKLLMSLLFCSCAGAQVSDVGVVQNLKSEVVSEKSMSSEELRKILEKYFNDGCKIIVNNEEIILQRERFSQYANVVSAFLPKLKKDYELEIPTNILGDSDREENKGDGEKTELSAFLNISKEQRIKIDFTLENKKLSEVTCKDVPISRGQGLMLRGIFNLLK